MTPEEKQAELNNILVGKVGSAARHRVDERGIPMPDWWDDSETTESIAMQNMFAMKSWRGGTS